MNANTCPVHSPESMIYKSFGSNGVIFSSLMLDNDGNTFFKACVPPENYCFDLYRRGNSWAMFMEGMGKDKNSMPLATFDLGISSEHLAKKLEPFSGLLATRTDMAIIIPSWQSRKDILLLKVDMGFPARLLMMESIAISFINEVISDIHRPLPDSGHVSVETCQAWTLPEENIEKILFLWKASKMKPYIIPFVSAEKLFSPVMKAVDANVFFDKEKDENGRFIPKIFNVTSGEFLGVLPAPETVAEGICNVCHEMLRYRTSEEKKQDKKIPEQGY